MHNYAQLEIPNIIIKYNEKKYNLTEYYQTYKAIHKNGQRSKWIINVALIPEELKENLQFFNNSNSRILLTEKHRNSENIDIIYKYEILAFSIEIVEKHNCIDNPPLKYKITITGLLYEKEKKRET